jgi:hypothetical protein
LRLVRVRPGGSAVSDHKFAWRGTRVEFRFLPPTTAAANKATVDELIQVFRAIGDDCIGLKLRGAYRKADEATCDLYRLDEQLISEKRCVVTSPPSDRCKCYLPVFRLLGEKCTSTSQLKATCAQLTTCPDRDIADRCSAFRNQIYIEYLKIFGYAGGAVVVILGAYAYSTGIFTRLQRAKLTKTAAVAKPQGATTDLREDGGVHLGFDDML